MGSKEERLRNLALGAFAEGIAAEYYIKKGYVILERNWRIGKTEIDLILQDGNTIIFSEVKARKGDIGDPVEAVTRDKMKRMIRASDAYISTLKGDYLYRFDIVAFTGDTEDYTLEVYENAFYSTDLF